ncbi:hypothetical protein DM860_003392 [Cuscuta australis]|uniref:Transcription repressor n=1 Tax=Cuscuta australis TaxID=267555 RepID=A0A328DKT1_9ASTE|nr:hypothetical protein DM860_003392 [Cuscuta australis]
MKLPFPFLTKRARPPYCPLHRCVNGCPKTLSFRAENETISELVTFTENDPTWSYHHVDEHPSPLSSSSSSSSSSEQYEDDHVEDVVRGLRSERLVFEPGEAKSSKLLEERVEMETMVSSNPFEEFRRSMEEMVEGHEGLHQDWEFLEELLACYLRINGRDNHGYIVGAFVDLLVHLNNGDHRQSVNRGAIVVASSSSFSSSKRSLSVCGGHHCLLCSSSSSYSSTSSASPLSFCSTFRPSTATA